MTLTIPARLSRRRKKRLKRLVLRVPFVRYYRLRYSKVHGAIAMEWEGASGVTSHHPEHIILDYITEQGCNENDLCELCALARRNLNELVSQREMVTDALEILIHALGTGMLVPRVKALQRARLVLAHVGRLRIRGVDA